VILCDNDAIDAPELALGPATHAEPAGGLQPGMPMTLAELERAHIERVLAAAPTLDAAARLLGIDASTLYRKRRAYRTRSSA
jgi:NtrC-family two-component system response regulator AlgB